MIMEECNSTPVIAATYLRPCNLICLICHNTCRKYFTAFLDNFVGTFCWLIVENIQHVFQANKLVERDGVQEYVAYFHIHFRKLNK
jgi:hypothetical protein